MLIGLLGKKRSGKDTFADYCCEKYEYKKTAIAKPLKDISKILFNFTDEQLYGEKKEIIDENWGITPRRAFQFIGTDLIRDKFGELIKDIGNDFWIKHFEINYREMKNNKNIIVSDIRFQNEVDMIKKLGGIIIKIERINKNENDENKNDENKNDENENENKNKKNDLHISENEIDEIISYDFLIKNNKSIVDYKKNIDLLFKKIRK